jgi:hypothetical protein
MKPGSLHRRNFLRSAAAAVSAPLWRADRLPGDDSLSSNSVVLSAGDLTAVVGDNSAGGEHRAGYNGIWSLRHSACPRDLFVPAYAGLNLEHIFTGARMDEREVRFEPRHAPMRFRQLNDSAVELHQPPTPTFHVESWTRFEVGAPDHLDMHFRCRPHEAVFPHGYLGLFWASYINAPADKSMYFLGGIDGQHDVWTQLCTPWHNDQSTVRHRDDALELTFDDDGAGALFKSISRMRFDRPFFYGCFENLVWLVMCDRSEGVRFAHSPSGGGRDDQRRTTNPAWDLQFVIPQPEVGREYSFKVQTILRRQCSRDELLGEFEEWSNV